MGTLFVRDRVPKISHCGLPGCMPHQPSHGVEGHLRSHPRSEGGPPSVHMHVWEVPVCDLAQHFGRRAPGEHQSWLGGVASGEEVVCHGTRGEGKVKRRLFEAASGGLVVSDGQAGCVCVTVEGSLDSCGFQ